MAGGRALLSGPRSWCELLLARRFGIQNEKRNVTLCSQNGRWMTENSLPKRSSQSQDQRSTLSNIAALVGAGAMGMLGLAGFAHADEAEHGLQAPSYPWSHSGWFSSYDHASIRRGHQVYKEVCAACHAMSLVTYRDLIGVAYTEAEVKALASEIEVEDGPNDAGEMFMRPGKPSDHLQAPYANEQAARAANGGAYPPDLSLICKVRQGLHYNPYFIGGAIAMPKVINDGQVEYDDGTPASASQIAKDVVTYLSWAAEPEADERKLIGAKWILGACIALFQAGYFKRWKWAPYKSRRIIWDVVN
ncbi:cytochrome c1-2, heme protein, mitochondrial isoform X2 [Physcomitrium patens]|uniref:cytochrome c1-2, heme protein, mitochondrial isoform X2 n=1 Tax=Physcomitrium patens TaxID=3218 RepID=UPI000D1635CE|nr:cytochrome c1-2, heme protein, mitochondrial-like isoform X2 [Physcomitrium patens]|eukprot:XP_024388097.1 cytochrome c1-2, heme protein, mitochondrial-like isoform X2 [Physcomitrella patens]